MAPILFQSGENYQRSRQKENERITIMKLADMEELQKKVTAMIAYAVGNEGVRPVAQGEHRHRDQLHEQRWAAVLRTT